MSEDGKTVDMQTTIADEVDGAVVENGLTENTETAAEATPRKKKRLGPWFFLALIFIGLPAGWFLSPPEMRQQAQNILAEFMPRSKSLPHPVKQTADTPSTAQPTEPASNITPPAQNISDMPDSGNTPPPADNLSSSTPQETITPLGSDEASLDEGIKRLRMELTSTQFENRNLHQQMQAQQKQTLSFLLHMLAQPQTHLAQQIELWGHIASLPGVDEKNSDWAKQMVELADKNLHLIKTWRQILIHLAERLPDGEDADVLPKPENEYFAWLIGNFHLRHAPQQSDLLQAKLRHRLMDAAQSLLREEWPSQGMWETLISDVHQRFGADVDVPDSKIFSYALREIAIPHESAAKWLEAL